MPSIAESSVPVIGVTLLPFGLSTVICRSMNLSSSFCVLTRSNWKFCSSTRVDGSVSEVNVTVVGSMSAATSVNDSCERPCLIFISRSSRTSAYPGTDIALGTPWPGIGR